MYDAYGISYVMASGIPVIDVRGNGSDWDEAVKVTEIFDDVFQDWYTGHVQYVFEAGLKLEPQGSASRAQLAAILQRFCEAEK